MKASRMKFVTRLLLVVPSLLLASASSSEQEQGQKWSDPFRDNIDGTFSPYSKNAQELPSKDSGGSQKLPSKDGGGSKRSKEPSCSASSGELIAFRHLVQHVVGQADAVGGQANFQGSLSRQKIRLLRRYVSGQEEVNIHDVRQVLQDLLVLSIAPPPPAMFASLAYVGMPRDWQLLSLIGIGTLGLVLLSFLLYKALTLKVIRMRQFMIRCLLIFVILSVPWEWYRLYSVALAKHEAELMKGMSKECGHDGAGFWTGLSAWMRSTFTVSDDPCLKYHEAMLVNPLAEVSPSQAVGVAFTRLFTDPLQYVFSSAGKCLRALLRELPVTWHPFIGLIVLIVVLLFTVTTTRYEVKMPLLFSFSPSRRQPELEGASEELKALIQAEMQAATEKLLALQHNTSPEPAQAQPELLAGRQAAIEGGASNVEVSKVSTGCTGEDKDGSH